MGQHPRVVFQEVSSELYDALCNGVKVPHLVLAELVQHFLQTVDEFRLVSALEAV